jgi:hypothetical protein
MIFICIYQYDDRKLVRERCEKEKGISCVFVESICNDKDVLAANYQMKLLSPDYMNSDSQTALEDFKERVKGYEKSYSTLSESTEGDQLSYIKIIDVGKKVR